MSDAPSRSSPSRPPLWPVLRTALAVSFWPIADQAMVSGSNFFTNIVIARDVGAYDFGLFTLAWSAVLLALTLQLCLISSPMFALAADVKDEPAYYGALFTAEGLFTVLVFAILYGGCRLGAVFFAGWPFAPYALPVAVVAIAYLWQDFVRRCLFSRQRTAKAFCIDFISYPVQLGILLLTNLLDLTLDKVLWIIAGTSIASAALGIAWALPVRWRIGELRLAVAAHWAFARWTVGSIAMDWVVLNVFYIAAGALLGVSAVAGLRGTVLLFAAGNVFFLGLENFVPGQGARLLAREGFGAFQRYMRFWLVAGLLLSVAISLCIAVAPRFWLRLAFGDLFLDYVTVAYILCIMYPLTRYVSLSDVFLRSASATRPIFLISAAMAALAVAIVYPSVAWFGTEGAVAGQLLCYAIGCCVAYVSLRQLPATGSPATTPDSRRP